MGGAAAAGIAHTLQAEEDVQERKTSYWKHQFLRLMKKFGLSQYCPMLQLSRSRYQEQPIEIHNQSHGDIWSCLYNAAARARLACNSLR